MLGLGLSLTQVALRRVGGEEDEGGGGPEWVPEDATLHADFIDEQYWDGSEEVAVLDVIAATHPNWFAFDPETDMDADGVGKDDTEIAGVAFTGETATLLQSEDGFTAVAEVFLSEASDFVQILLHDDPQTRPIIFTIGGSWSLSGWVSTLDLSAGAPGHGGRLLIAFTITQDKWSVSINGDAVETLTPDPDDWAPHEESVVAIQPGARLRKLTIYPAQDDADLPALGAPPSGSPENTVAPVVSGTPVDGETLSCSTGTWTGDAPITYEYQWLMEGSPVEGATTDQMLLGPEHVGLMISCRVTANNSAWATSHLSNSLGPVETPP